MARKTVVGVSAVRAFAAERGIETGKRGRVPAALIEQFEKETGQRVEVGFKAEQTVVLSVPTVDKAGRKRTRKVTKPLSEARALAGEAAGERGTLSAKAIEAAGLALAQAAKA